MKPKPKDEPAPKRRKAIDPEARQDQMIALATDLAEEQIRNGTATSQVITHYLKLGTEKTRLERELLEQQVALAKAKTEALESAKDIKELYSKALVAMTTYRGEEPPDDCE